MSLRLFSFLQGYLIISVSGFSVERFINLAMNRNIYLSDITYKGTYVTMRVSIKGFKLLKPIAKKTKCKIKIVEKKGLPFYMFKYRKRKILALGIIFFLFSIYILSTKIWLINIEGIERVYYNELMSFVNNEGLYLSANKSDIDTLQIQEDIINAFDEIAWVNINLKGTKATIQIKETIVKKEADKSTTPSNIIATKDGIIDTIVVSNGTAVVKPYDVVKKGDILVEGTIKVKEDEFGILKTYVPSNAEVLAKTYYNYHFTVPYDYEYKEYTGKQIVDNRYKIFEKSLDLLQRDISYKNYTRTSVYNELDLGENYPLPFIVIKDTYKEFNPVIKTRSIEETKEKALEIVDNKILMELAFDVNIVDKSVKLSENSEGIEVFVSIEAVENIVDWEAINIEETQEESENIRPME